MLNFPSAAQSAIFPSTMTTATSVTTQPFEGQKPGTSGLRKKVTEFLAPHHMENFIQCTLLAVGDDLKGATLVVGGDGRYGVKEAVQKIIQMSAANGVSNFILYVVYQSNFPSRISAICIPVISLLCFGISSLNE